MMVDGDKHRVQLRRVDLGGGIERLLHHLVERRGKNLYCHPMPGAGCRQTIDHEIDRSIGKQAETKIG